MIDRSSPRSRFLTGLTAAGLAVAVDTHNARAATSAPLLDVVNERPIDWGTPLGELGNHLYTPNRVFFIRSHMGPPNTINASAWHLDIGGLVTKPLRLSLADLKSMPHVEVPAVLQCSGNGRFFYGEAYPGVSHPAGAQWTYGSVGNARWGGVRVRDVLDRAGVQASAKFANNFGMDNPVLPATPKFIRGIELEKLMDPDSIFAYEMNGEPIPYYHGYPVRLVVPGWAGDHWVKWFTSMTLSAKLTANFWTSTGYRYPDKLGAPGVGVPPNKEHPVLGLNVKSLITGPLEKSRVIVGKPVAVQGFAWSGDGATISKVDISTDAGKTWQSAELAESSGTYSWRPFTIRWSPEAAGRTTLMARATDSRGSVQPALSPWNPSGYMWNGIHRVEVEVASA